MKNSEMSASPLSVGVGSGGDIHTSGDFLSGEGLSKMEYACIHCGVPNSGDPDLDAIIAEGNKIQKAMIDAPLEHYSDSDYPDLSKINVE